LGLSFFQAERQATTLARDDRQRLSSSRSSSRWRAFSAIEKTNGRNVMVITDGRTFGFHALRHSLATFLVSKDVDPKTVQAMLRHSNVTTTLQLYAKTVDGKRLKAQEQILDAIFPPASRNSREASRPA